MEISSAWSTEFEFIEFFEVLPARSEGFGLKFSFESNGFSYMVVIEEHCCYAGMVRRLVGCTTPEIRIAITNCKGAFIDQALSPAKLCLLLSPSDEQSRDLSSMRLQFTPDFSVELDVR
jgi:hypothetical protein